MELKSFFHQHLNCELYFYGEPNSDNFGEFSLNKKAILPHTTKYKKYFIHICPNADNPSIIFDAIKHVIDTNFRILSK